MNILTELTNDIAFRLRLQAKVSNLYEIQHPHMVRIPTIYEEAADEIERLRAELQLAHSEIAIMATAKIKEEPF